TTSLEEVGNLPVIRERVKDPLLRDVGRIQEHPKEVLLRNVARIGEGTAMGQYDRYNMQRLIAVRANVAGADLGSAARQVARAIAELGPPPPGVNVALRGQVVPMQEMLEGLRRG